MALQEKLNNLAASAGSKVNSAIESGKLHIKINNEERKITEFILNLGELTLDKLDAGETYYFVIRARDLSQSGHEEKNTVVLEGVPL